MIERNDIIVVGMGCPTPRTGSPFPFECENCGHKPPPQEVLDHKGDCAKCGDTVITYTVDAAECVLRIMTRAAEMVKVLEEVAEYDTGEQPCIGADAKAVLRKWQANEKLTNRPSK